MASQSSAPAFMQVAEDLRRQIETGALPAGAQLPSMSQIRQLYGVSNTVVRDALNELRRAGLTIGRQGKGVFVRDGAAAPDQDDVILARLDELTSTVRQLDQRLSRLEAHDAPARRPRGPAKLGDAG